jgi:Glycosyltransferase family 87
MVTNSRRALPWIGLAVVGVAFALNFWHRREPFGIDFHTYLAAAAVGLRQGWTHIYDQPLVALVQRHLVPSQWTQPFLSPPTVAWLVAPLTVLPYWIAYNVWTVFTFAALAGALAWSGMSTGITRWVAVLAALAPWWVLHAVAVGQVVPLVAAAVVVAWRLLREEKQIAAGLVLSLIFLKPNTAILVPFALLAAGRHRALTAWLGAGAVMALIAAATLGTHGLSGYVSQLAAPLPAGADALTLKGALGATGLVAAGARVLIVGIVLVTAFKLRASIGLAMPVGIVGSLIVAPYLHASDLCLLSAAAWIVWEERRSLGWRVGVAAGWVLASPYLFLTGLSPGLNRWPLIEGTLLLALVAAAFIPLTGTADLRSRAPA